MHHSFAHSLVFTIIAGVWFMQMKAVSGLVTAATIRGSIRGLGVTGYRANKTLIMPDVINFK